MHNVRWKLTGSQLSLSHGIKLRKFRKLTNKNLKQKTDERKPIKQSQSTRKKQSDVIASALRREKYMKQVFCKPRVDI